jgi:hypothetical protein
MSTCIKFVKTFSRPYSERRQAEDSLTITQETQHGQISRQPGTTVKDSTGDGFLPHQLEHVVDLFSKQSGFDRLSVERGDGLESVEFFLGGLYEIIVGVNFPSDRAWSTENRVGNHLGHLSQSLLCLFTKLPEVSTVNDGSDRDGRYDGEHDSGQFGRDHDHGSDCDHKVSGTKYQ